MSLRPFLTTQDTTLLEGIIQQGHTMRLIAQTLIKQRHLHLRIWATGALNSNLHQTCFLHTPCIMGIMANLMSAGKVPKSHMDQLPWSVFRITWTQMLQIRWLNYSQ